MPPFCFSCEGERRGELTCRACGERECAACADAERQLCEACSFEAQSAATLQRFFQMGDESEPQPDLRR